MTKNKKIIIASIGIVLIAIAVLICLSITHNAGGKTTLPDADELSDDDFPESDFSNLTWTEAFTELNEIMSKQYAFTEWKGIEWQELYNKYIPAIKAAEENDSFEEYYLAMLSYICEIPDGHVSISHDAKIDSKYNGGSFGFTLTQLDDGKIIVTWVDPEGLAVGKGIRVGDEIITWNNQPILSAVESVSTIFSGPASTNELLKQKRLANIIRAPIGTEANITLSDSRSFVLKAYDDQKKSTLMSYPYTVVSVDKIVGIVNMENGNPNPKSGPDGVVEMEMMDGNILYVKLWALLDLDTDNTGIPKSTAELMRKAVAYANDNQCTGMVLDVRNNVGGMDEMVTEILGLFYSEKTFYEYQKYTTTDKMPKRYIEPEALHFNGSIIALINSQCISSGEGIAQGIKNLDNGETLGFYGTNGAFGMTGGIVRMPGDIMISYPLGQSLDINETVQIDSKNGIGGVSPSIRIPMTRENALLVAEGVDVELEEALLILKGE